MEKMAHSVWTVINFTVQFQKQLEHLQFSLETTHRFGHGIFSLFFLFGTGVPGTRYYWQLGFQEPFQYTPIDSQTNEYQPLISRTPLTR